jgi:hypothetical protein
MERYNADKKILNLIRLLFIRIGSVDKEDERFDRYSRLRKTYKRLCLRRRKRT